MILMGSLMFLFVIETNCQTISTPYLYFLEQNLSNNSYVDINLVGHRHDASDSVQCISDLPNCCDRPLWGDWHRPDGTVLGFPGSGDHIFQDREHDTEGRRTNLRCRNDASSPTGIYHCNISFNASDPYLKVILYIGLYTSNEGDISVSHDVRLTVVSDLNGESPQFTLTCTSTGGPATIVTWTRHSTIMTEGNVTVLDDPVTANYTHTLTVTGRLPGLYTCYVENNKPSTTSTTFTVQVASPPTELGYTIGKDSTSVILTWTPPTPLGYTTGYRISFTGGGNVTDVSGGSTDNYTLTGLRRGEEYNISIIGLSQHFFSERVLFKPITLKPPLVEIQAIQVINATAVNISWSSYRYLYTVLHHASHYRTTGAVMTQTLTNLIPGVVWNIILLENDCTLDDSINEYIHTFTLFYAKFPNISAVKEFSFDQSYFQIQFGPIHYCLDWTEEELLQIEDQIKCQLVHIIHKYCINCTGAELTPSFIRQGLFLCHSSPSLTTYRSTLVNPFPTTTATDIVGAIQSWVEGRKSLVLKGRLVRVNESCPTEISSLDEEECETGVRDDPGLGQRITQTLNVCAVRELGDMICHN